MIRERMAGGQSLTKTAEDLGVSPAYLCLVLKRKRSPGPKLLAALGLERTQRTVTKYFRETA